MQTRSLSLRYAFCALAFTAFALLALAWHCEADSTINRCLKYKRTVIREANYYIGLNKQCLDGVPVSACLMAQIEQESQCKADITAFDGGMGLGQFMPSTAEWMQEIRLPALSEISDTAQPYNPQWAIRALVLYDSWLYTQADCVGWYFAFRGYNGGIGLLNKEIARAKSCEARKVESVCKRKVIRMKNGNLLDMCNVNIKYPNEIFNKAKKYDIPTMEESRGK